MAEQGQVNQTDQVEPAEQKEQIEQGPGGWTDVTDADPQTALTQQVADNVRLY